MNPEEGDLRPQLLDRFGLAVDVRTSPDPDERADAVSRRVAFDADPEAFVAVMGGRGGRAARAAPRCVRRRRSTTEHPPGRLPGVRRRRRRKPARRPGAGPGGRGPGRMAAARPRSPPTTSEPSRPWCWPTAPAASRSTRPALRRRASTTLLDQVLGPADPAPRGHERHRGDDHDPEGADGDRDGGGGAGAAPSASVVQPGPVARIATLRAPRAEQPTAAGRRSPAGADRGRTVGADRCPGVPPVGGTRSQPSRPPPSDGPPTRTRTGGSSPATSASRSGRHAPGTCSCSPSTHRGPWGPTGGWRR